MPKPPESPSPRPGGRRPTDAPRPIGALLALLGLWAFAFSQPLLTLLGDEPGFFVVRDAGPAAIALFAVSVTLVPPLLLWLVGIAANRIGPRIGVVVHSTMIALLATAALVPLVRRIGIGSTVACVGIGLVGGALFTWAYVRVPRVATWTQLTVILPVLSLFAFLVLSPTGQLVTDRSDAQTAASASDLPSVAFLVLDELPTQSILDADGNIDVERFPNLARLAAEGTWYRNSTTVANGTVQAVPAMLSGMPPTATEPVAADHPDTLFSLLAPTHDLVVSESFTALCGSSCVPPGEPAGFGDQLGDVTGGAAELWGDRITGADPADALDDFVEDVGAPVTDSIQELLAAPTRFTEFLDAVQPSADPTLWFLHLVLPHQPWRTYPNGTTYSAAEVPTFQAGWWPASVHQQRHLYQAAYTDRLVGQFLDHLREIGEYDDTTIVVASDHGVAFQPGQPDRLWSPETIDEVAYAPLLIKAAGRSAGSIDDRNVMTVDIVPTVADQLGIEVPWAPVGVSLERDDLRSRGDDKFLYDFGPIAWPTSGTHHEFSMADTRPSEADRWVGQQDPGAHELTALLEPLDVTAWLGQPIASVADDAGPGEVVLDRPDPAPPGRGFVSGQVRDHPSGHTVLVAVDGIIVTASPIVEIDGQAGRFLAMLPTGATAPDALDRVEIAIVDDDTTVRRATVT